MSQPAKIIAERRLTRIATQEKLIEQDLVGLQGRQVTALSRIQLRRGLAMMAVAGCGGVILYIAGGSRLGSEAFISLCWTLTALVILLQLWSAWDEMRYLVRKAYAAACEVLRPYDNDADDAEGVAVALAGDASFPGRQAVVELVRRELLSLCSRRHIPGYVPFKRSALIVLAVAIGALFFGITQLHMWDTWPPAMRPTFVCAIFCTAAFIALKNALTAWLEDLVACAVFVLGSPGWAGTA